jgi:hypothetical protein
MAIATTLPPAIYIAIAIAIDIEIARDKRQYQ